MTPYFKNMKILWRFTNNFKRNENKVYLRDNYIINKSVIKF